MNHLQSFNTYAAHCLAWIMGKDCGRGNEQLGAKVLGGLKQFLKAYRLGYLFRTATNLRSGIFKSGDIARENFASYYVTSFQRAGLRNPPLPEFCGIFMNENS